MRRHLERAYGESWFANAEAGELLRGLWATGESEESGGVARMLGYGPFDASYLADQFLSLDQLSAR